MIHENSERAENDGQSERTYECGNRTKSRFYKEKVWRALLSNAVSYDKKMMVKKAGRHHPSLRPNQEQKHLLRIGTNKHPTGVD
jgi:hypothetical protein